MDSVVEDDQMKMKKKHDQGLQEAINKFEDEGDQGLQETIKKFEDEGDQGLQEPIKKFEDECDQGLQERIKKFEDERDQGLQEVIKKLEDEGDQGRQETIKKFEDEGDQDLQKMIKMKKRPPRCHDDEGVQKKKKQRRKKKKDKARCPHPPPDLPVMFRNRIRALGGSDVSLVIQKSLFQTDVSSGHNRLSIPLNQIQQSFLTPEENEKLNSGTKGKKCAEMEVMLIEPSLHRGTISLRKWDMKKSSGNSTSMYVLVTNWNSVAWRNALRENDTVQLWSFRVKSSLGFALVKRRARSCCCETFGEDPGNLSLRGIQNRG